jgi:hypothetical protein
MWILFEVKKSKGKNLIFREQPISDKPCVCGALLNGTRTTQHWEGGKGMRDTTKLSKNDSKKFAGQNKTHSMKDARVGPKN